MDLIDAHELANEEKRMWTQNLEKSHIELHLKKHAWKFPQEWKRLLVKS